MVIGILISFLNLFLIRIMTYINDYEVVATRTSIFFNRSFLILLIFNLVFIWKIK